MLMSACLMGGVVLMLVGEAARAPSVITRSRYRFARGCQRVGIAMLIACVLVFTWETGHAAMAL